MPPDTKKCGTCGEVKPTTDFYKKKSKGCPHGLRSACIPCTIATTSAYARANPELRKQVYARSAAKNPTYQREYWLRKKYGLSMEDWQAMLDSQNGVCAICSLEDKNGNLHVDHCHATGVIRGLLCGPCNKALGLFRDRTDNLDNAITYLRRTPLAACAA